MQLRFVAKECNTRRLIFGKAIKNSIASSRVWSCYPDARVKDVNEKKNKMIFTSHITSHHITSHHIIYHIISHHITSHNITSHHITSHYITSHHITSDHISTHHTTPHTPHHTTSTLRHFPENIRSWVENEWCRPKSTYITYVMNELLSTTFIA